MAEKRLLFSVTASDCEWSYTRGTGNGGQKKNKTSSAVHCKHKASGAAGYAEDSRSQHENKRLAFERMVKSKEFQEWHKMEIIRRSGELHQIERAVDQSMRQIKVEGKDENGRWVELNKNSDLNDDGVR